MANDIKLQSEAGFPLDENLRPLKIGNKISPLELSDTDVKVNNLIINGTSIGGNYLPLTGGTLTGDLIFASGADITSTDLKIEESSNLKLDVNNSNVIVLDDGVETARFYNDGTYSNLYIRTIEEFYDYFQIQVRADGKTTILTNDSDLSNEAQMTFFPAGDLKFQPQTGETTITGSTIIDKNTALTATGTAKGLHIDYDHTGISASGQTVTGIGLDLDMNCESVTHVGTVNQTGIDLDMTAAADGTQSNVGIDIACSGSDNCTGLIIDVDGSGTVGGIRLDSKNGGKDFVNRSSASTADYFMINTIAAGATTLSTVDTTVGATAHLTLDIDGDIILSPLSGVTEFHSPLSATDLCKLTVAANGVTTIATTDSDGALGHLTLDIDGDIILDCAAGKDILIHENGGTYTPASDGHVATKKYVDDNAGGGSSVLTQVEVIISEAEMNALHTTEKELVAAQGTNMVIIPVSIVAFVDRDGSTSQGNAVDMRVGINGSTTLGDGVWYNFRRFMWNEGGDRTLWLSAGIASMTELASALDGLDARNLTAKMSGAITSGSIDSVKIHVTYYVYDNS